MRRGFIGGNSGKDGSLNRFVVHIPTDFHKKISIFDVINYKNNLRTG